jgi:hypothetical protein
VPLPRLAAFIGGEAANLRFDGVVRGDADQGLGCDRRRRVHLDIVELPPHVAPAESERDVTAFGKVVGRARRAAARRGRRLRIMFADEARFGRINRPRPCWAPRRIRITMRNGLSIPSAHAGATGTVPRHAGTVASIDVFMQMLPGGLAAQLYGFVADGTVLSLVARAGICIVGVVVIGVMTFTGRRSPTT